MIFLLLFAFLAGVVTILSPCILPLLPVILSSSVDASGKKRPLGVVLGFILSFTFFTLFLASIVKISGVPASTIRYFSVVIFFIFGLSLIVPKVQIVIEQLFSKLARFAPNGQNRTGFFGGLVIGLSLGLLWTPCVGPILASVITLALSGSITLDAVLITFFYSAGTAIPMFVIMLLGSTALSKIPWLLRNSANIQKGFGMLMIFVALGIFFNLDKRFQTYILDSLPKYGVILTSLEKNNLVEVELEKMGH